MASRESGQTAALTVNAAIESVTLLYGPNADAHIRRCIATTHRRVFKKPRHTIIYDVTRVFDYLCSQSKEYWEQRPLKEARAITVTLLRIDALCRSHGASHLYRVPQSFAFSQSPAWGTEQVTLRRFTPKEANVPAAWAPPTLVVGFPFEERICSLWWLRRFTKATEVLPLAADRELIQVDGTTQGTVTRATALYVSTTPRRGFYYSVGSQCLSNDVKSVLSAAGIDTDVFKGHSTRHASSSYLHHLGVPIERICEQAHCSEQTLRDSYLCTISQFIPIDPAILAQLDVATTPLSHLLRCRFLRLGSASTSSVLNPARSSVEEESIDVARPQAEA